MPSFPLEPREYAPKRSQEGTRTASHPLGWVALSRRGERVPGFLTPGMRGGREAPPKSERSEAMKTAGEAVNVRVTER